MASGPFGVTRCRPLFPCGTHPVCHTLRPLTLPPSLPFAFVSYYLAPLHSFFRSVARFLLPHHRPRSKKRRVRKFSYGIPARVVAVGAALVPTLSALRSPAPIHCFLPTRNLWCRIGVRSCVAALIIVTFSLSFQRSLVPSLFGFQLAPPPSLHFRCEEVLISISFSPARSLWEKRRMGAAAAAPNLWLFEVTAAAAWRRRR